MEWAKKHWYIVLGVGLILFVLYRRYQSAQAAAANAQAQASQAYMMYQPGSSSGYDPLAALAATGGLSGLGGSIGGGSNLYGTGTTTTDPLANALATITAANTSASDSSLLSQFSGLLNSGGSVSITHDANGGTTINTTTPTVDTAAVANNAVTSNARLVSSGNISIDQAYQNVLASTAGTGVSAAQLAQAVNAAQGTHYTAANVISYAAAHGVTIH